MMDRVEITSRRQSAEEILSSLQSKYDLVSVPLTEVSDSMMAMIEFSAEKAVTNEKYNLKSNQMRFLVYRIPKTSRNSCLRIPYGDPEGLFIIEMNTSYFFSDIRRLFIEATSLLGFDEADQKNGSNLYRHVMSTILMGLEGD